MLHRDRPFGRKPVRAALDPDAPSRIRFYDERAVEDGVPYLIYSETTQRFIGYRRNGIYHLDGSETSRHMQLVFFPEARA